MIYSRRKGKMQIDLNLTFSNMSPVPRPFVGLLGSLLSRAGSRFPGAKWFTGVMFGRCGLRSCTTLRRSSLF